MLKTQLLMSGFTISLISILSLTVGYALLIGLVFTLPKETNE